MRNKGIFLLLFIGGMGALNAQSPAYLHYTVRHGLPGNFVHCGLQDQNGLLWFGTDKGLASFDGMRFRVYGVAEGLPDPEVLHIQEDSKGRIWLFCFRKKPCYLYQGRIITEAEDPLLAALDFQTGTYTLEEGPKGDIWLAEASKQTYRVADGRAFPQQFPDRVAAFGHLDSTLLVFGLAWIMRIGAKDDIEVLHRMAPAFVSIPSVAVSGRRILYAYTSGLVLLEWKDGRIRQLDSMATLSGQVYTDHLGRFWVCSPAEGAVLFDNAQGDLSNPTYFLRGKKVNRVFEDAQRNLWFCTLNEGIYVLQRNAPLLFQDRQHFPSLSIRSLARMPNGDLLAGDDAGNIHILNGAKYIQRVSIGSADGYNLVRQIVPIAQDSFWAVSDEGLFRCSPPYRHPLTFEEQASIKSIWIQPPHIWLAAATFLSTLDPNSQTSKQYSGNRFTAVAADAEGHIWAGGIDGLYAERDRFQMNWGDHFPELKQRIMAIHKADSGYLWIVTAKDGLLSVSVRAGTVTDVERLNQRLSTPIRNIQSCYVEPNQRVWLATNRGIYGIDRDLHVVHFSTADGLADDDVNAILVHNDTLWAGTVSGISRMVLKQPAETGHFKTRIVGIAYEEHNQPRYQHLLDSTLDARCLPLSPNASMIELHLTGLDYRHQGNLHFQVSQTEELLPLQFWTWNNLFSALFGQSDTLWLEASTFRLGAHVPAGRYRIQAVAIRPSGLRSQQPDEITLVKYPHWYATIWFFLLVWGVILYGVRRFYRTRLEYQKAVTAAANLQLQALQAQMNPHFIGNSVNAIQQFLHPPNPEKTSEYIAMFVRLLRRTMHYAETPIITLQEELAYIREYLELVQLRLEDKFRYTIEGVERIPSDTPMPSMLLQPILENATQHGLAPQGISVLEIAFAFHNGNLRCSITDNGVGLRAAAAEQQKKSPAGERVSKGMELMHKKIESLNQIYLLNLTISVVDLSDLEASATGTRVVITFTPSNIWKAKYPPPAVPNRTS